MRKIIFTILVAFALTSCSSVLVYHMDVLHPANFNTTSDKSAILLLDNSGIQPSTVGHTLYGNSVYKQDTAFETELASGFLLDAVAGNLSKEGYYDKIEVCKRNENQFRKEVDFLIPSKLSSDQVKVLGDSLNVDLLVSLDRIVIQSRTNVEPYNLFFRSTRDVSVNTVWRVFDLKSDSLLTEFQYNDSLYWEKGAENPLWALAALPNLQDVQPEIGEVVGEHVYRLFSPWWESINRYYYTSGGFRMKYAVDCIRQKDWEGAATLWREEFEKGFGKSVYRSAMNMMLYCELSGNPKEALVWANKAVQKMNTFQFGVPSTDQYIWAYWVASLKQRVVDVEKLERYFNSTDVIP